MLIEIYLFVCGCGGLNTMSKQEEQKNEQRQIACEHRLSPSQTASTSNALNLQREVE